MNLQKQIDELLAQQAAQWVDILRQGSTQNHEAFLAWVAESPRNVDEFLSIAAIDRELEEQDLYRDIDRDAVLGRIRAPHFRLEPKPKTPEAHRARPVERTWKWMGLAAAVAMVVIFAGWLHRSADSIETGIGEQRALRLPDGSVVYLNAKTRAQIHYGEAAREIRLEDGEALFSVAPQSGRPFQVRTRDAVVRALGTQFNIASRVSGTRVEVLEGKVRVSHADGTNADVAALSEGQAADIASGKRMRLTSRAEVAHMAAWRQRRLVFVKAPLEEVVEEFNRFSPKPIRLKDVQSGGHHYSGAFDADDPKALVAFLEKEPDLEVRVGEDEIVIRRR